MNLDKDWDISQEMKPSIPHSVRRARTRKNIDLGMCLCILAMAAGLVIIWLAPTVGEFVSLAVEHFR